MGSCHSAPTTILSSKKAKLNKTVNKLKKQQRRSTNTTEQQPQSQSQPQQQQNQPIQSIAAASYPQSSDSATTNYLFETGDKRYAI